MHFRYEVYVAIILEQFSSSMGFKEQQFYREKFFRNTDAHAHRKIEHMSSISRAGAPSYFTLTEKQNLEDGASSSLEQSSLSILSLFEEEEDSTQN